MSNATMLRKAIMDYTCAQIELSHKGSHEKEYRQYLIDEAARTAKDLQDQLNWMTGRNFRISKDATK